MRPESKCDTPPPPPIKRCRTLCRIWGSLFYFFAHSLLLSLFLSSVSPPSLLLEILFNLEINNTVYLPHEYSLKVSSRLARLLSRNITVGISILNKSHYFSTHRQVSIRHSLSRVLKHSCTDLYAFPLSRPVITASYFRRSRSAEEFPLYLDSRPSQFPLVKHGHSARLNGIPSCACYR